MNISKTHTTNASIKWFILTIALISIALLSYPVKAETGSVTVFNETRANWSTNDLGLFTLMSIRQVDNMTQFAFDTGNYTSVVNYTIWDFTGELSYAYPNEVTSFTITANGTGHGTASYSQFLRRLQWVFSGDTVITGSPFNVTYDSNIFQNVTSSGAPATNGWDFVAANSLAPPQWNHTTNTMPMYVFNSTGSGASFIGRTLQGYDKAPNTRRLILSGTFSSGTVTNFYTITYPNEGFYLATITKTGQTVSTKDILHTQTNNSQGYYTEANFNTNNFQVLMPQLDGIYLNVTMGTGDFNDVLINASGSTVIVPTNNGSAGTNITTCTKPNSGANICFDAPSYFVGDNINASWYLSDSTNSNFYNKKLRLTLNDIPVNTGSLDCGGCISITQQNGFYIYQATASGILKAEVIEGIVSYTPVGSGSVQINPPGASWIAITNTTMNTRTLNNVTYHVGYSVANYPAASIEMDINDISNGNLIDVLFPTVFPDGTMTFGQVHPIPVGNFSIRLIDSVKNQVLDTKYFTAIPLPQGIPTLNITTSTITTDKSTYFYNDYMQVNYAVDDANFSNYNYTIMAHIISLDFGNITTKMIINPFADQVGTFTSVVNIDKTMKCEKGLNCWFNTGNNSINLVLMNNTASVTIAYANFTVSSTTVDGYGLQTSTTTPTTGVQFTATTTIPAGHTGYFSISNAGTVKSIFVDNQTINNTGLTPLIQTIPETIRVINTASVAYYVAELYGDDGRLKVRIPLTVTQVASGIPGGWTKREDVISGTCSSYDGWVGLMFPQGINDTNRFAFALVWIVAILFLTTVVTKNIGIGISFAFLPYAFFLYLSLSTPCGTYMPTWTGVFIALIIGIKLRWFN